MNIEVRNAEGFTALYRGGGYEFLSRILLMMLIDSDIWCILPKTVVALCHSSADCLLHSLIVRSLCTVIKAGSKADATTSTPVDPRERADNIPLEFMWALLHPQLWSI